MYLALQKDREKLAGINEKMDGNEQKSDEIRLQSSNLEKIQHLFTSFALLLQTSALHNDLRELFLSEDFVNAEN